MQTSEWISIIGWPVTFVLGLTSAVLVGKMAGKKRVLAWTILGESDIFSKDVLDRFGVPIEVTIDGKAEPNPSSIRVKLGNKGNTEIKKVSVIFSFGPDALVHVCRFVDDLGEYAKRVSLTWTGRYLRRWTSNT